MQAHRGRLSQRDRRTEQQPGKDLLQYGVGELTHTMLRHGLIDELRLMVFPFTFGNGSHIFESMGTNKFNLLSTKSFTSGAIALHYQPLKGGNV
jgi:dihydrofolate reductase